MTIFAVYQLEDGRLVSSTNDATKVATSDILAARGYGVAQRPDSELNGVWNPATLSFAAPPANPTTISTYSFILRFATAEFAAIKASTDPQVGQFMLALPTAPAVDLADPVVTNGVNYLASIGLITAARATAILTP